MTERQFDDREAAEIFRLAAETSERAGSAPGASGGRGLTLAELQAIGSEVGLPAEAIASAARALDGGAGVQVRRMAGLPIGVERVVPLPHPLSEAEWERLVVRLREVFEARGRTDASGTLRQWTNGNLQALLEPTEQGQRLRLRTTNGNARASVAAGSAMLGVASAVALAAAVAGSLGDAVSGVVMLASIGAAMVANGALRLPAWARRRAEQMEQLADELSAGTPPALSSGAPVPPSSDTTAQPAP